MNVLFWLRVAAGMWSSALRACRPLSSSPSFPFQPFSPVTLAFHCPLCMWQGKPGKEKETQTGKPSSVQQPEGGVQLFSPSYLSRTPTVMPLLILASMRVTDLQFHSRGTGPSMFLAVPHAQPDRIDAFISDVHLEPKWSWVSSSHNIKHQRTDAPQISLWELSFSSNARKPGSDCSALQRVENSQSLSNLNNL